MASRSCFSSSCCARPVSSASGRGRRESMARLLETRGLTKRFGGLVANEEVSILLERGEIRGLIGPNGAGKTTFVNLVTGIHAPSAGDIRLDGESVLGLAPFEIARKGLLRTFQVCRLFGNLSVFENVLLQVCCGFMIPELKCYVLDEPFAGINPVIKDSIIDLILHENRARGVSYLIVSHEMAVMRRLCSKITVMIEGRVVAEGPLEEIARRDDVITAYLGKALT